MSVTGQSNSETKAALHSKELDSSDFMFWFIGWFGIALAGGAFGLLEEGVLGTFFGTIIAGLWGVPVVFTFSLLTWVFWLTRFSIPMVVVAGACTGIVATYVFGRHSIDLAGIMGAVGGGFFTTIYAFGCRGAKFSVIGKRPPWRYSLGDLFLRFTVVTVIIAGWTAAAKLYFGPR